MHFNSLDFALFLLLVFFLYWFVCKDSIRKQNILILAASYTFYGWWDYRFLLLIIISSAIDYTVGLYLQKATTQTVRKWLLSISIFANLGILLFFKYYNFFIESFVHAFSHFGITLEITTLYIILPVGISFYTFQTLSYTIDIYRNKIQPTRDIIAFFAFVSFFPQLVAGPIERAKDLLTQFLKKRQFSYQQAVDGLRQMLWGLFKKVVIADNCAEYIRNIFNNYQELSGSTLLLGLVLFSIQIYCDFSGYSDIAIGTGRLFGFKLKQNFAYPYFSRNIAEFWRRWHISLTNWFKDYLYIPLGGSRGSKWQTVRNIFLIFLISGFWHGANWKFIFWGFFHACLFLPLILLKTNRKYLEIVAPKKIFPTLREFLQIVLTFTVTSILWIFFRATNIHEAFSYLTQIFTLSLFSKPEILPIPMLLGVVLLLVVEWFQRHKLHALQLEDTNIPLSIRNAIYTALCLSILYLGGITEQFIYFQF